jgi:hypothetical protein
MATAGIIVACLQLVPGSSLAAGTGNSGQTEDLKFRPFDKSSVPMLVRMPPNASELDRRLMSRLDQDDYDLVPCMWHHANLEGARDAAQRLAATDLLPDPHQGTGPAFMTDTLMAPLVKFEFGKIDKNDLWTSKYWDASLFTVAQKLNAVILIPESQTDSSISSLSKEDLQGFFRHDKAAVIVYRAQPAKEGGMEAIAFRLDAELVKFKEAYAAARQYCKVRSRNHVSVVGWHGECVSANKRHAGGIDFSDGVGEQDTIMNVGFACV